MQGGRWNAKTSFLQASTCLAWKRTNKSTYITEERLIAGKCWDKDHNAANAQVFTPVFFPGLSWDGEFWLTHQEPFQYKLFKKSSTERCNKTNAKASWRSERRPSKERLHWVNESYKTWMRMGGVHMQALGYSVCHVYQTATERQRERWFLTHTLKCKQAPQALSL